MDAADMNPTASNPATEGPRASDQAQTEPPADRPAVAEPPPGSHDAAGSADWPRPLCRPVRDRMLAGVAIGVASYLGIDVLIVRIALAVLTVVGGAGVPIYLAGWLLIPEEGAARSIASELLEARPARSS